MPPLPPEECQPDNTPVTRGGRDALCRPGDLGRSIPPDPHAISVCLPTWRDVIGYEEGEERVRGALQTGYPRFVVPPFVHGLHGRLGEGYGGDVWAFASRGAAARALRYVRAGGGTGELVAAGGVGWLLVKDEVSRGRAREFWRYAGEGVSGRAAEDLLAGGNPITAEGDEARRETRERLAGLHGVTADEVYLFPSGMAAVSTIHRFLSEQRPGAGTVQIDFPYVDVARVQKHLGNCRQVAMTCGQAMAGGLERALRDGFTAAVYAEVPANPLLECADLPWLAGACARAGVPLVADDTVASVHNVALLEHADFVTTSLSKWFNGKCNLLAGAITVNPGSLLAVAFKAWLAEDEPAVLADRDAVELAANSRSFGRRMETVNANGAAVAAFLRAHPAVGKVWFPSMDAGQAYGKVARGGAGPGGLMSFTLHGGEPVAAAFYDAVAVDKGPSLGADFSLLCPYTLLAHYDELPHAAAWGVPRDLLRLSVGLEPAADLCGILERALEVACG